VRRSIKDHVTTSCAPCLQCNTPCEPCQACPLPLPMELPKCPLAAPCPTPLPPTCPIPAPAPPPPPPSSPTGHSGRQLPKYADFCQQRSRSSVADDAVNSAVTFIVSVFCI
jgi:hypothetical protein